MAKGISASKPGLFYAACAICQVMYCSSPAALLPFPDAWRGVTYPGFRSLWGKPQSHSPGSDMGPDSAEEDWFFSLVGVLCSLQFGEGVCCMREWGSVGTTST